MDIFAKHQIRIAKDTLKLSDIGARIMGGMTKAEAREILKKHGIKFNEEGEKNADPIRSDQAR